MKFDTNIFVINLIEYSKNIQNIVLLLLYPEACLTKGRKLPNGQRKTNIIIFITIS